MHASKEMMNMRLFFGLTLPDDVRRAADDCARRARTAIAGRYAPAENYHITLAFLGEVEESRLDEACAVLAREIAAHPAPVLTLDGLSHFGRAQNGILIIRVHAAPSLDALHGRLIRALHASGLPADPGPFSPHITLARHAVVPDTLPDCPPLSFTAHTACVFISARDGENVLRYTPVFQTSFSN